MDEKTIKSEILKGLKSGKSKSELYEDYNKIVDDTVLRRILASRPSHFINKKFLFLHKTICYIWILIFIMDFLGTFEQLLNFDIKGIISLFVTGFLLIQLWKFNGDVYLPSIFWLFLGIFNSLKEQFNLPKDDVDYDAIIIISWSYILLLLITISIMSVVRKNIFSYYSWFKPAQDNLNRIVFQKE